MSIESLRDLSLNDKKLITRRAFIQALAIGALAACTPPSPASDPSQKNKGLPSDFPDSPLTPTPEVITTPTVEAVAKNISFTADMIKGIYPDEISIPEWADIGVGKNIPLPFGPESLPFKAVSLRRSIKVQDRDIDRQYYDNTPVGTEFVDRQIGYVIQPGTILYAFTKCLIKIQPLAKGSAYYEQTTRFDFSAPNANLGHVFIVGGKIGENLELLADIPVFGVAPSAVLEAGAPICRIIKPVIVPNQSFPSTKEEFTTGFHVRQSTYNFSGTQIRGFFYKTIAGSDQIIGSDVTLSSLKKTADGKFVSLYSPTKK